MDGLLNSDFRVILHMQYTDANFGKPETGEMRGARPWSGGAVKGSLNSRWRSMPERDLLHYQFVDSWLILQCLYSAPSPEKTRPSPVFLPTNRLSAFYSVVFASARRDGDGFLDPWNTLSEIQMSFARSQIEMKLTVLFRGFSDLR